MNGEVIRTSVEWDYKQVANLSLFASMMSDTDFGAVS